MKDIIELNAELEKLYKPSIEYSHKYNNILFNGFWVNEINSSYFRELEEQLKERINNISDVENKNSFKYLEIFYKDILKKYNTNSKIDYQNLEQLKNTLKKAPNYSKAISKKPVDTFNNIDHDFDYFFAFFGRMCSLYDIGDIADYFDGASFDEINETIDFNIIDKFGYDSFDPLVLYKDNQNIDESFLANLTEEDSPAYQVLKEAYIYTHFSICLEIQFEILKKIAEYFSFLLDFLKRFHSPEEGKLSLVDIQKNDPSKIKLEFQFGKRDIAFFFRALFDTGLIHVENRNQKYPYTNLTKYLNNANIYYNNGKDQGIVKNIARQFSDIKDNWFKKEEIYLLELVTTKLNERKKALVDDKEEGIS